jgi:hypothetical protein
MPPIEQVPASHRTVSLEQSGSVLSSFMSHHAPGPDRSSSERLRTFHASLCVGSQTAFSVALII